MLTYRLRTFISVIFAVILTGIFCSSSSGQEGAKVAVLYFANHSGFDSSGGCLSIWPLSVIFGKGTEQEKWDLESGFRDMLNEKLIEAGYHVIEPSSVNKALLEIGEENSAALARSLDADIMIVGDIRKFQQHRRRASSQGPTTFGAGGGMQMVAMGGIGGFFYSASVNTNVAIYDSSGDELESSEVSSKKNLRDFYMGVGPMTYHRGDRKEKDNGSEQQDPIVDYKKLDTIKFGTDEYKNKTLFGMATTDVMDSIVAKVGEYLEPVELSTAQGKIIYVGTGERLKENEVYINLGAGDGLKEGLKLGVYIKGIQLTDPDTGEELGTVAEEKVGSIKISKVEAEHLSLAEIVEKTSQIEQGNIVKRE